MNILVSGLVNIETTLKIDGFPLPYFPVHYCFGAVGSSVSGVGVNVAKALKVLGDEVHFLSLIGSDANGFLVQKDFEDSGFAVGGILPLLKETPQSVILYDDDGRREIHVDLKDIQDWKYPNKEYENTVKASQAAVLCNINFNRHLLPLAKAGGIPILTDVHVLSDPKDTYNTDFMSHSDILFLSNEKLWDTPKECAKELLSLYSMKAVIIGLGEKGALLAQRERPAKLFPAVITRKIVNTIGAGDALFSAFTHFWLQGVSMEDSVQKAIQFASWKIGEKGAASGFLTETELASL